MQPVTPQGTAAGNKRQPLTDEHLDRAAENLTATLHALDHLFTHEQVQSGSYGQQRPDYNTTKVNP